MIARGIQSFGRNGLWLAGWLSNGQNFFLKFAQTCDKQTLKISSHYLERFQIYCHLTEKFWQSRTNWPILYGSRRAIAIIFQLNDNKSETAQDIDLKFSAFVHHMAWVNWREFLISWKKIAVLKFFKRLHHQEPVIHTPSWGRTPPLK